MLSVMYWYSIAFQLISLHTGLTNVGYTDRLNLFVSYRGCPKKSTDKGSDRQRSERTHYEMAADCRGPPWWPKSKGA